MDTQFCKVATEGRVMTITIDRPEMRNALHAEAHFELAEVFDRFEADPALWVAILTASGDKAFSAGADLRTPSNKDDPRAFRGMPVPETGFAGLTWRFARRKPVIAAVNGFALGGGFEAALACDVIVAAKSASFGLTEPKVGLAALGGGIQRIVQELGPKRAHAMLLTARRINAAQAHDWGLVAEVVPDAQLLDCARRWADEIAACSPASMIATRAIIKSYYDLGMDASNREMFALSEVRAMLGGPDAREGGKALFEKRPPVWADSQ
ncbi:MULTISPECIES: enoyl-CoA hydratase-related protein [Novosphingobium]|jgi:enoyl-CoA hydratase/carnithine racemase|uniref:enoyl-CoA hydratase-related protein n=1 Tax=Novosphingobium TaxID=165696 RepID=UPI0022F24808|nr:enoyl-CoA hydratase-related protein [Novosphingobium resinovorum]GLK43773.1 enoyl-CoA hydratase [Novosphingobium resinovorum]